MTDPDTSTAVYTLFGGGFGVLLFALGYCAIEYWRMWKEAAPMMLDVSNRKD